jgi:hypothetical protein
LEISAYSRTTESRGTIIKRKIKTREKKRKIMKENNE